MNRPHATPPKPSGPPSDPRPGGDDATVAATAIFDGHSRPASASPSDDGGGETVQATIDLASAASDATVEVTNLAFPRPHLGAAPDQTIAHTPGSTRISGSTRPPVEGDTLGMNFGSVPGSDLHDTRVALPTLDGEGKTNAYSLSGEHGGAEIHFDNMPKVAGYTLLSELGRGGMGVVYKARQTKLDRLVALKMVLAGAHASADQLARFLIEAQAVAALKHNHIVQIHDVGERDGLPFFSLEFVDGGSLQQTIGGKPQPVRFAAKIVKTLAEAMHFAHQQGIIHRDLKPANVLMTKNGDPKITDFGLAKRLEGDSQQTRDGAIMGTPSYMAPEQAWGKTGEIGPLADQHAIGAILYEMLTGRPPYQGANPLDTLEQVRNQEPVPPTRLQPKVPKDLETISLKALQKDPKKRYEDVGGMAADLERYLNGEPILARPVSAPERAWRWCRRNPKIAASIAAVASMMVVTTGVALGAAVVFKEKNDALTVAKKAADDAKTLAQQNEKRAKDNEDLALKREREAHEIAQAAIGQTDTMIEAQRYVSVLANMRLRDIPGTDDVRKEMLKVTQMSMARAVGVMDELRAKGAGSRESDAMVNRTLAGIHQARAEVFMLQGGEEVKKILPELQEMERLTEALYKLDPTDLAALKNKASSKYTMGDYMFRVRSDVAEARKYYAEALEIRRHWLEKWPQDDVAKRAVANALGALARLEQVAGDPLAARPLYEQEVTLRESLSIDAARDSEARRELAGLYDALGDLYSLRLGKVEDGRRYYERSYEVRQDLAKEFEGHAQVGRDILLSYQKFGTAFLLFAPKDPAKAKDMYFKAALGFKSRFQADPNNTRAKSDFALALYYYATACLEANALEESDKMYRKCLDLRRELAAEPSAKGDPRRVAEIELMLILARCREHAEAAKIADDVLKNPPENALILKDIACGYALCYGAAKAANPPDESLVKRYRDASFKALRDAIAHGWKSADELVAEPDIYPIQPDPEFDQILQGLRK